MRLKTKRIHRIGIKKPFGTAFQNQNIWTLEWTLGTSRYTKLRLSNDSNNQSFDVPFPSVLEDTSKSDDQILDDYDYGPFKIIDNYDNDNSETESGTSEEYDGFEEFEITAEKENKIWDDKLIQGLRLLHVKVLHFISDEAFNKISNQLEQCSKPLTKKRF
ncbi:uncharacterized protein OCT59_004068 [Rhizophagus irregularis]|uniref:uncharacterized protein n=1 Tax=Rhizophagus irregularis TaxID=588596 RepID=UPI0033321C8A|nr:hypothetical protein OCT59_004068 [Rhizophagus irregularis]